MPSFHFGMNHQGMAAARPTCSAYVDGRKREHKKLFISENIVLLLHPHVDVPYSLVVT